MNEQFSQTMEKVFGKSKNTKGRYEQVCANAADTLGAFSLDKTPLHHYGNTHSNDLAHLNLKFSNGVSAQIRAELLEQALKVLKATGDELVTILASNDASDQPIILLNKKIAVAIAQYWKPDRTSAEQEWNKIEQVITPHKVLRDL